MINIAADAMKGQKTAFAGDGALLALNSQSTC